jgi:hypothetical protein
MGAVLVDNLGAEHPARSDDIERMRLMGMCFLLRGPCVAENLRCKGIELFKVCILVVVLLLVDINNIQHAGQCPVG